MSCHPVPFYAFLCQVISCHAVKLMTTRQLLDRRQVPEVRAGSISKIHAFCSESCLYHAVLQSMPCCASKCAMLCFKVCHAVPQIMPCCASKCAMLCLKACHAVPQSMPCWVSKCAMLCRIHTAFCRAGRSVGCGHLLLLPPCFGCPLPTLCQAQ